MKHKQFFTLSPYVAPRADGTWGAVGDSVGARDGEVYSYCELEHEASGPTLAVGLWRSHVSEGHVDSGGAWGGVAPRRGAAGRPDPRLWWRCCSLCRLPPSGYHSACRPPDSRAYLALVAPHLVMLDVPPADSECQRPVSQL